MERLKKLIKFYITALGCKHKNLELVKRPHLFYCPDCDNGFYIGPGSTRFTEVRPTAPRRPIYMRTFKAKQRAFEAWMVHIDNIHIGDAVAMAKALKRFRNYYVIKPQ